MSSLLINYVQVARQKMTNPMYISGCHGVTPNFYVIAIYSTSTLKPLNR